MSNDMTDADRVAWQLSPLCRTYRSVIFAFQAMQLRAKDAASSFSVVWGLGVLQDGHRQVLGAWPDPCSDAQRWHELFDELAVRGVEQIRIVVNADPDVVRAAHPSALVLTAMTLQADASMELAELSPGLRRVLKSATNASRRIQSELTRCVRMRRSFDSRDSALACLEMALLRVERGLWIPPPVRAVSTSRLPSVVCTPSFTEVHSI